MSVSSVSLSLLGARQGPPVRPSPQKPAAALSRADLIRAKEARDREIQADKTAALSSPRMKPAESRKTQARARIQRLIEWLKIARKLYAENPKGMARTVAQAFKELKAALKEFKSAIREELSLSGEATHSVVDEAPQGADAAVAAPPPAEPPAEPPAPEASAEGAAEAPPEGSPSESTSPSDPASSDPSGTGAVDAGRGASLYAAVEAEVRKAIGEEGLDFIKELRAFGNELRKLLDTARIKAHGHPADKSMTEAFEDADKEMKSLSKDISDMEQDLRNEAPGAGLRLSVAA